MPCVTVCDSPDRIADGEHDVADAQPVRMPERHDGYVGLEVELQHREVGVRIAADDFRVGHASVGELRADQVRRRDDVMIGDHVRGVIHDHAGTQALFQSLAIARPGVAKQLFDGVGLNALGDQARRIDVDHGRRGPLDGFGVRVRRVRCSFRAEVPGSPACATGAGAGAGAAPARVPGARRPMSSGRTTTAMNAAASPTIAEAEMKVRNRRIGRVDMSQIILIGRRS